MTPASTVADRVHTKMLAFIQAQPSVVDRILRHIETPALVDLLFRIMQLDECSAGVGVLDVCAVLCLSIG